MSQALTEPASADASSYLQMLGRRTRRIRAQRGMSRRILSESSGVSERYLAQLEAGKGNASILLLKAIAEAMNVAIDDLVDALDERPVEYLLLRDRLRAASEETLRRMNTSISTAGDAGDQQPTRIALIGLRGAGKSTIGAALAKRAGVPFVELVQEIERAAGMSVNEIFSLGGQKAYRRFERDALSATLEHFDRAVVAVGGSLVSEPETYELLLKSCYTVWLTASPQEHMERVLAQGDHRPMARHRNAMADLKRILKERKALYSRANVRVDSSHSSVDETLRQLLEIAPVSAFIPGKLVGPTTA